MGDGLKEFLFLKVFVYIKGVEPIEIELYPSVERIQANSKLHFCQPQNIKLREHYEADHKDAHFRAGVSQYAVEQSSP